ncbi:MAG: hypothetical protein HY666_01925 [Chloroflexi bacterium]|nr:hypothetical protein [Chloroflexota bacterium]
MSKSVMVFGIGDAGGWALEFLARYEGVDTIYTADIRKEYGLYRTEMAAVGASNQGHYKRFEFHELDVNDIDNTARLLEKLKPNVIFSALTLQSPRAMSLIPFPPSVRSMLGEVRMGLQLPWHLTLISKLMKAVKQSGIAAPVVNASFPDAINPILWRKGLGPTCGIGNSEHQAADMRRRVSEEENVPISDVRIYLVGSLALLTHGSSVPFYLKITVREKDVTNKYNAKSLIDNAIASPRNPNVPSGFHLYSTTGASAAKNVMAILNDTREFTHAAAPNGLPGTYPVHLGAVGAEIALPKDLSLGEAMEIGEESLKWHGIEGIKEDGTVVYTDRAYGIMKELLGYDCKELYFDEVEQKAKELTLLHAYKKFAERFTR